MDEMASTEELREIDSGSNDAQFQDERSQDVEDLCDDSPHRCPANIDLRSPSPLQQITSPSTSTTTSQQMDIDSDYDMDDTYSKLTSRNATWVSLSKIQPLETNLKH